MGVLSGVCLVNINMAAELAHFDHVYLVVMENHSYQEIMTNVDTPFIHQLARTSNVAEYYFAVGHPSLCNYLEMVGGSNFGIQNDDYPAWHGKQTDMPANGPLAGHGFDAATPAVIAPFGVAIPAAPFVARSIADQLVEHGLRWKSYQESLPASGEVDGVNFSDGIYTNFSPFNPAGAVQKRYAAKHNPFVYFASVQNSQPGNNSLKNVVGFTGAQGLYADLASGHSPAFSFIVPNLCHDMHGVEQANSLCADPNSLEQMGDATLQQIWGAIHASPSWVVGRNVAIVVWDENGYRADPNQVLLIVDTSYGKHGIHSTQLYSHFSLLKTLEQGFGLPCLNHACDPQVKAMNDLM